MSQGNKWGKNQSAKLLQDTVSITKRTIKLRARRGLGCSALAQRTKETYEPNIMYESHFKSIVELTTHCKKALLKQPWIFDYGLIKGDTRMILI